ncbi:hypothetical protein RGUI_3833 [Rhodovulum sp. P5]|uniref:hypothetical protein n=1 Tax=Rhodovulum sp. P5 TaxID=1564506 RepID=UPI0009C1DD36|nr:hypothetical protein [Rhodovulum sp. P5]ARE41974.1 hypothetical protein RGUI_3833 [Rhodovulum sp. P5]
MTGGMRTRLKALTGDIHESLHHDPLLSRLIHPDVTATQYCCALQVFARFYDAVETARRTLQCWPDFALSQEVAALRFDTAECSAPSPKGELPSYPTPEDVLGALYVAHGANYGRSQFRKTVSVALPDARRRFIEMKTAPEIWRALVETLDREASIAGHAPMIERGAVTAFAHVSRMTSGSEQTV